MPDDIDRAQDRAEILRNDALTRFSGQRAVMPDGDGTCADCGEDIPPARMKALGGKALRCTPCEEDHEKEERFR